MASIDMDSTPSAQPSQSDITKCLTASTFHRIRFDPYFHLPDEAF